MATEYSYVVQIGRNPGIYATPEEAKAQTFNVPGGSFKKFKKDDTIGIEQYLSSAKATKAKEAEVYAIVNGKDNACGVFLAKKEARDLTQGVKGVKVKKFACSQMYEANKFVATESAKLTKTSQPITPMSDGFVYVVRVGRVPGVYTTLEQAQEQVVSYAGSECKTFAATDIKAIGEYLYQTEPIVERIEENPYRPPEKIIYRPETIYPQEAFDGTCVAFTDGSYSAKNNIGGAGVTFFYNGRKIELSEKFQNEEYSRKYRNVACELYAVLLALECAKNVGAQRIIIRHDFKEASNYVDGTTTPKKIFAQEYVRQVKSYQNDMMIEFDWVKGHSDNKFNDLADKLAKRSYAK